MSDVCLTCPLSDCDDSSPECPLLGQKIEARRKRQRERYRRMMSTPEGKARIYAAITKYRRTERGKAIHYRTVRNWHKIHPEKNAEYCRKFREKRKDSPNR